MLTKMEEDRSAWLPSSLSNRRRDDGSERSRTLHNVFKSPMPILENSVANITANSSYGRYINSSSLIIIDEVSMCPLQVLKIIDRLLWDLCHENDKRKPFGRKTILLLFLANLTSYPTWIMWNFESKFCHKLAWISLFS